MTTHRILALAALGAALLAAPACTDSRSGARATAVLVDVSGTYADRLPDVMRIVRAGLLPGIRPGDTFMVFRIADRSYADDALVQRVTLDTQPSRANAQKLGLAQALEGFAESQRPARFTDVSGALLLASEHLKKTGAGKRSIVIFSDMREELPKGVRRKLEADELVGVDVYVYSKRLPADINDPAAYRARLEDWENRLKAAGAASWTKVESPQELAEDFSGEI